MRTTAVAAMVVVSAVAVAAPAAVAAPDVGPLLQEARDVDWRDVIDRAVAGAATTAYEASMVVVTLDADGPGVTEVAVRRADDGSLVVEASDTWLLASSDDGARLLDARDDQLLEVGDVQALPFVPVEVDRRYEVEVAGRARLATGSAVALAFSRDGVLRERLYVDDATDLVVRRETYRPDGEPVRVTALTELRVTDVDAEVMEGRADDWFADRTRVAPHEVEALTDHAWSVPTAVGDGFDLRAGYLVDKGDAVQLVYSDGLYTVSVLEQPGRVDPDALDGAVHEVHEAIPVYRWPGLAPQRVVWSGADHTFTAVSDAPTEVLLSVVADLPHDVAPSMPDRLGRGLSRIGRWVWPFD